MPVRLQTKLNSAPAYPYYLIRDQLLLPTRDHLISSVVVLALAFNFSIINYYKESHSLSFESPRPAFSFGKRTDYRTLSSTLRFENKMMDYDFQDHFSILPPPPLSQQLLSAPAAPATCSSLFSPSSSCSVAAETRQGAPASLEAPSRYRLQPTLVPLASPPPQAPYSYASTPILYRQCSSGAPTLDYNTSGALVPPLPLTLPLQTRTPAPAPQLLHSSQPALVQTPMQSPVGSLQSKLPAQKQKVLLSASGAGASFAVPQLHLPAPPPMPMAQPSPTASSTLLSATAAVYSAGDAARARDKSRNSRQHKNTCDEPNENSITDAASMSPSASTLPAVESPVGFSQLKKLSLTFFILF